MVAKNKSISQKMSGFVLPGLFVLAWVLALSGVTPPGAVPGDSRLIVDLRWLLYFAGFVFIFSSVMHSVFARKMAASIGWKTNGFQYEIAAVSLGLGLGCFYAVYHGVEAWVAISLPIVTFLFLAGLNHLKEIITKHNFAPNNLYILIWDFGMPISLVLLLLNIVKL
ncbi:hypothetical protein HYX70_05065 [Candidatus Saccharibacteria bacterium]|nr:hypothetical protein [Candidatus Saccharibacteria bacterium]